MDDLLESHALLVRRIANDIAARIPRHVPREDLISWGLAGLYDAARRFDPAKTTFRAYAKHRIRGAILDGLRSMDPCSRADRQKFRLVQRATEQLARALGREPDDEESACNLGVTLAEWHALRDRLVCFWTVPDRSQPLPDVNQIPGSFAGGYDAALSAERRSILDRAIATLPARYQAVILLRYRRELTLKEIATRLKVNESRVSQIHRTALGRLKRELSGDIG